MLNLALNKPAIQSSTSEWSSSNLAEEDAKGANNGRISRGAGFHTNIEQDPWWQVDLKDEFLIKKVVIFNRQHQAHRLKHFSVLTSLNGREWRVAFAKADDMIFGAADDLPYHIDMPDSCLARFVRIRLDAFEYLHFNECQVFGYPPKAKSP